MLTRQQTHELSAQKTQEKVEIPSETEIAGGREAVTPFLIDARVVEDRRSESC